MAFAIVVALAAAALGVLFVSNVRNFPADLLESAFQHWNRWVRGFGWIVRRNDVEPLHLSSEVLRVASVCVGLFYFVVSVVAIGIAVHY